MPCKCLIAYFSGFRASGSGLLTEVLEPGLIRDVDQHRISLSLRRAAAGLKISRRGDSGALCGAA
jgi:hypothetical protein